MDYVRARKGRRSIFVDEGGINADRSAPSAASAPNIINPSGSLDILAEGEMRGRTQRHE